MVAISKGMKYGGLRFHDNDDDMKDDYTTAHTFKIPPGITPPQGVTDEVIEARKQRKRERDKASRARRKGLAAPIPSVSCDNSKALQAARDEARRNALAYAQGKPISYEAACKYAELERG